VERPRREIEAALDASDVTGGEEDRDEMRMPAWMMKGGE
jgi:hypothetical protein